MSGHQSFFKLRDELLARPGAAARLARARRQTLAEIERHHLAVSPQSPGNQADQSIRAGDRRSGEVAPRYPSVMKHELVDRYRGRWVGVDESGDVVADASELSVLLTLVEQNGPRPDVVVQRVPEVDAPMFVGLD